MSKYRKLPQKIPCDKNLTGADREKVIYLRRLDSRCAGGDLFRINDCVGEGGSCICYDATLLGEKKSGRLKEFYPLNITDSRYTFSLARTNKNHIVSTSEQVGINDVFLNVRHEFIESYRRVRDLMEENRDNSDFTGFIPDFTLYAACDDNGEFIDNSTVYVWSHYEKITVFSDYIKDIRRKPDELPEHKLFTVLSTLCTLAECIKILHEKGLLHLDIKPSNFAVPKRREKLLTDTVSLFDINSFYSTESDFSRGSGTDGFRAPEVYLGNADNRSDIYSIGCTLFSALIITDEITESGFRREYYDHISRLVDESELIKASETNSNMYLKWQICNILNRCLAELPARRYQTCGELIKDIKTALTYLYPAEFNDALPADKQLVILSKELDKKRNTNSGLAFEYHLYEHPLYKGVDIHADDLNILIAGFGNYSQKFLDCCIQSGQLLNKKLNITVLSNDKTNSIRDRDFYLQERPMLKQFFSVDGSYCEEPYGNIKFISREFNKDNLLYNRILVRNITAGTKINYVFIALGSDSFNLSVAQAFAEYSSKECSVNFAYEGDRIRGRRFGNPVYVNNDFTKTPEFKNIERMAFNAHLVWKSGMNIDLDREKKKFRNPYFYASSLANVISVKYKLYSMGIETDDLAFAAREFAARLKHDPNRKEILVAAEHRRWVCQKICDGWVCESDPDNCLRYGRSNRKDKKHICLVRSSAVRALKQNYSGKNLHKWDTATDDEINMLDPLDRVSVMLHRKYKSVADKKKSRDILNGPNVAQIRAIIQGSKKAGLAFSEWYACLTRIWNGGNSQSKVYEFLRDAFADSLDELDSIGRNSVETQIKSIDAYFKPILKSMEYFDFKSNDTALVESIPFILTYRHDIHLAIPFSCGNNSQVFANISAATVINPARITYIYNFENNESVKCFCKAMDYVLRYMSEKQLKARLNFVFAHKNGVDISDVTERFKSASRISGFKAFLTESAEETRRFFVSELSKKRIDAFEINETELSVLLSELYVKYPSYRFDSSEKSFETQDCDMFKYIKADQYLRIADMFAMRNSKGSTPIIPEFYNEYERLRSLYCEDAEGWRSMCGLLSAYSAENDLMAEFTTDTNGGEICGMRYILPTAAFESAHKILKFLGEEGIAETGTGVHYYTTDSCVVNIRCNSLHSSAINRLFGNIYALYSADNIRCESISGKATVCFDNLVTESLDLTRYPDFYTEKERIKAILKRLSSDFGFVSNYTESGDIIGFSYATAKVKDFLMSAGRLLEIYIYHKCLNSNRFDDIANDYMISWEACGETREFDIIITKGFASLFIQATTKPQISAEQLAYLESAAKQYGVNCKAVLIADNLRDIPEQSGDVVIITERSLIDSIDDVLESIL